MSPKGKFLSLASVLLLGMMLPNLSFASSNTDYSNSGGTLVGSSSGLSLSGSTLIAVSTGTSTITGSLGTVTFSTGALTSGSWDKGGTVGGGGTFTVTGNGTGGVPNGVLFTGTFTGSSSWTLSTLANGTHNYTLTGEVDGTMGGITVSGVTEQLTINTGRGYFDGMTTLSGGDTAVSVASVPETSTLALFGTGVLAIGSLLRKKIVFAR